MMLATGQSAASGAWFTEIMNFTYAYEENSAPGFIEGEVNFIAVGQKDLITGEEGPLLWLFGESFLVGSHPKPFFQLYQPNELALEHWYSFEDPVSPYGQSVQRTHTFFMP